MNNQLELFASEGKKQTFIDNIDPNNCVIDPFNSRKTRPPEHAEKLAARMSQYGYDKTRAVWVRYDKDGILSVFAGGTRLDAAKQAGIKIAVILHEGYTDEEVAWLTELDNESDEYHVPVGPVDTWAEYARLRDEEGWETKQIADAKGIDRSFVAYRLKLHDKVPSHIKEYVNQKLLTETHLIEITKLGIDSHFSLWLTTVQAWEELVDISIGGIKKDGKKSTRATAKDVDEWKKFIALAEKEHNGFKAKLPLELYEFPGGEGKPTPFDYDAPTEFVLGLAEREARSQNKVTEAAREIRKLIKENLADYKKYIDEKSAKAARDAIRDEKEKEILDKFVLGDCLKKIDSLEPKSVSLLLVDPPYGQDYQSNRRWVSDAPPKIEGDVLSEAETLLASMLEKYQPTLRDDAHLLIFSNWQNEPAFRCIVKEAGFTIKGSLIWAKEEHSAGDLKGAFAPSHERIIHAVQGKPVVEPRIRDVLEFSRNLKAEHPTSKPIDLLETLINSCTIEGDLVIDPLAGEASTLLAAWNCDREFWGCEIDPQWHDNGCSYLLKKLEEELDGN